jgi:haloacetate dehalogenase
MTSHYPGECSRVPRSGSVETIEDIGTPAGVRGRTSAGVEQNITRSPAGMSEVQNEWCVGVSVEPHVENSGPDSAVINVSSGGQNAVMFDEFRLDHVDVGQVKLRVRWGGSGPAVLLVHGHPRTHTTWYAVAPMLVEAGFSVVCADLRGYGESTTIPDEPDHRQASKREMAADLLGLMHTFGHERFHIVGHDRGGYVVQRLALDHPEAIDRVVILGDVPIGEALARCDARFATAWYHWFLMGQPAPLAERLIAADVGAWYHLDPVAMGAENYADAAAAVANPAVQHAMVEDYRAGLGVDRAADDADRAAGRQITSPLLVLWGARDDLAELYDDDVLGVWAPWAPNLSGGSLDTGHHLMEEAPAELAAALVEFFRAPPFEPAARPSGSVGGGQ